jgi:hypothetical protein
MSGSLRTIRRYNQQDRSQKPPFDENLGPNYLNIINNLRNAFKLTNSVKCGLFWEADSYSVKKIAEFSEPKISLQYSQKLTLYHIAI